MIARAIEEKEMKEIVDQANARGHWLVRTPVDLLIGDKTVLGSYATRRATVIYHKGEYVYAEPK